MTRAHYLRLGALTGVGAGEAMRMPPGRMFDLFELYVQSNSGGEAEID